MKLEPKIKNLVSLFNNVPYIWTTASCRGHFLGLIELEKDKDLETDECAHIIFELPEKKEKEFENLAYSILSNTSPYFSEFLVEVNKRYYSPPESKSLYYNWELDITPFEPANYSPVEKRKVTDKAINLREEILIGHLKK